MQPALSRAFFNLLDCILLLGLTVRANVVLRQVGLSSVEALFNGSAAAFSVRFFSPPGTSIALRASVFGISAPFTVLIAQCHPLAVYHPESALCQCVDLAARATAGGCECIRECAHFLCPARHAIATLLPDEMR